MSAATSRADADPHTVSTEGALHRDAVDLLSRLAKIERRLPDRLTDLGWVFIADHIRCIAEAIDERASL